MKSFNELDGQLNEGKAYLKKGRATTLKQPIEIGNNVSIRGLSRDLNGNALLQLSVGGKNKSIQYKNQGLSSIDIDELATGSFTKFRQNDVTKIIALTNL